MTGLFRTKHSCPRISRGAMVIAASLLAMMFAGAASADHDRRVVRRHSGGYHGSVVVSRSADSCGVPSVHRHGDSCACHSCFAQREYRRGIERGRERGFDRGYDDGLHGAHFCDAPNPHMVGSSGAFRSGFLTAFSRAYRDGYDRGRHEASRHCGHGHASSRRW